MDGKPGLFGTVSPTSMFDGWTEERSRELIERMMRPPEKPVPPHLLLSRAIIMAMEFMHELGKLPEFAGKVIRYAINPPPPRSTWTKK